MSKDQDQIAKYNWYKQNGVYNASFTPLVLSPLNEYNGRRRMYQLDLDFVFEMRYENGVDHVSVPRGFKTDLATIPLLCQVILGGRDDFAEEAVIHDWLCVHKMPGWYANSKMRSLMYILGRPLWKQRLVFWALQIFGYGSMFDRVWCKIFRRKKNAIQISSTTRSLPREISTRRDLRGDRQ